MFPLNNQTCFFYFIKLYLSRFWILLTQISQDQAFALYETAFTLAEKADVMQDLGTIDGAQLNTLPTIEQALQTLEKIPFSEINADSERLTGKLLLEVGKKLLESGKLQVQIRSNWLSKLLSSKRKVKINLLLPLKDL
jgi:hypothetical protein